MGLIGPEVADQKALNIPLDQAEILVTNKEVVGRELESFRDSPFAGQLQVVNYERGGVPFPVGLKTKLQRMDILTVVGLKGAVAEAGDMFGRIARPSTATDLLTLSVGMILGFLIGMIQFPAFGAKVGLGNAGGLLRLGRDRLLDRRRGCASSAIRRTRRATSSRISASSSSSRSSASTPATACSRS